MNTAKSNDPRRGIVLVAVLWTIALVSALALATSVTFRGYAGVAVVDRDKIAADGLLNAGFEFSAAVVARFGNQSLTPFESEFALSTGTIHFRVSDEGGRIDINQAPVDVLTSMLRAAGATEDADQIARSIDAWRKRDQAEASGQSPNQPQSATAGNAVPNQPQPAAPPQQGNQAGGPQIGAAPKASAQPSFTDVRQLAQIPGMTPEVLGAIMPVATVFGGAKINAKSAPQEVIALLPNIGAQQVEGFIATRNAAGNDDQLKAALGAAASYTTLISRPVALIELTAQLSDGYIAAARAVIIALPADNQPYRVLAYTPVQNPKRRDVDAVN